MQQQLEAVIFDWAGTIVDFGSFAPTQIFVDAFRTAFAFDLSLAEARGLRHHRVRAPPFFLARNNKQLCLLLTD